MYWTSTTEVSVSQKKFLSLYVGSQKRLTKKYSDCIAGLLTAELWPGDVTTLHKIEM